MHPKHRLHPKFSLPALPLHARAPIPHPFSFIYVSVSRSLASTHTVCFTFVSMLHFPHITHSPHMAFPPVRVTAASETGTGPSGPHSRSRPLTRTAWPDQHPDHRVTLPLFLRLRLERLSPAHCRVPLSQISTPRSGGPRATARRDARLLPIRPGPRANA